MAAAYLRPAGHAIHAVLINYCGIDPCSALLQFVLDEQGQLVTLGAGGQAVVFLGRLSGLEVAVKVGNWSCPAVCRQIA